MARRYRSRRRPSNASIAAMMLGAAGAAIALAAGWHWLGALGELAFVGMGLRALAIGALLAWICQRTGFSRARSAAAIAGLATVLCIVATQVFAFQRERADQQRVARELFDLRSGLGNAADARSDLARSAAELTFGNYLRRHFGLQGAGSDGAANFMGPALGIGLFSVELAFATLLAMYFPAGKASEPICERCGAWLCEEAVARAQFGRTARFVERLLAGACAEASDELAAADTREFLQLSLATCPRGHDAGAGVLRLREHFFARRGREMLIRHRADLALTPEDRSCLDAAIARLA